MNRPLIFISYSHKDEAEKDELLTQLGVLEPDLINLWSDDRLGAGVDWEPEINRALGEAKVAILLITANFLTSSFISRKEVPELLRRRKNEGLIVFPVIARDCAWRRVQWLVSMNVRPKHGNPIWDDGGSHIDKDLARIAEEVADIIEKLKASDGSDPALAPVVPPASRRTPAPQVKVTEDPGSPNILIVDDDADYRNSIKAIFKDRKIDFLEAGSVEEGKRVLGSVQDIRVILLDLQLPGEDGTKLLEHLRDLASAYRVIILTSHDELLPADKAALYKVFQYLSKTERVASTFQSLRFAVDQALQDIEREKLDRKNKVEEFEDVILNEYPTPFTYIYQELKSDILPLQKLNRQKDLLELLLNFSAIVILCEYLNGGARDAELDAYIQAKIQKPSLGEWSNTIYEILKRKESFKETFFMDAFSSFFTNRNRRSIGELIGVRNNYVGHGATHTDYEYENIVKRCDELLIPLLQDYQFITQFLLILVSSVQKVKGKYVYRLKECTGANPQLLFSRREFDFIFNANEVHLVNLDNGRSLSLHPFLILENCEECKQIEIFFYTKLSSDQLNYLSYKTGHRASTREHVKDFVDLIRVTS
jgi:CheY-like chemotaxis protein